MTLTATSCRLVPSVSSPPGDGGRGIGRQMGYFLRAYQASEQRLRYRGLVDFHACHGTLGSSPLHISGAVIYFGSAVLMLFRRVFRPALEHVNITGRGSTIRRYFMSHQGLDCATFCMSMITTTPNIIAAVERFLGRSQRCFAAQRWFVVLAERFWRSSLCCDRDRMIVLHNAVPGSPLGPRSQLQGTAMSPAVPWIS